MLNYLLDESFEVPNKSNPSAMHTPRHTIFVNGTYIKENEKPNWKNVFNPPFSRLFFSKTKKYCDDLPKKQIEIKNSRRKMRNKK